MTRFFATDAASACADICDCHGLSRRGFLRTTTAAAGAAFLPARAFAQGTPATKIDTHHHFYPPEVKKFGGMGGPLTDNWTPQKSIEEMDKNGVKTSILSMASVPMDWFKMSNDESRKFVRGINDYGAKMVSDFPGRYGLFAYLSMVDVEGSMKEIEYAFDTLKADGIGISTGYNNVYPGDPKFAPIFAELNRRKATVYFHPTTQTCCLGIVPGVGDSWAEVPNDTTRAVLSLMFTGSLLKLRDIKFLWSHGGGTIPMIAERIDWLSKGQVKNRAELMPEGPLAEFKRFYYDTANAGYPGSMAALMKLVDVSHIMFGTDYPYVTTDWNAQALRRAGITDEQIRAIETENAKVLLPRLKA
jgi:predicted TIM-barrel fold metal-dependent hydrolase